MSRNRLTAIFGVPLSLPQEHVLELLADIERLAACVEGVDVRAPGDQERYMEFLAEITDPTKRESSVRSAVAGIEAAGAAPGTPYQDQLFHQVASNRWIVSHEGMAVYRLLSDAEPGTTVITAERAAVAAQDVAVQYRDRCLGRLHRVGALLSGAGGPLLPPSVAILFLLLVNRSTDVDRALPRYPRERHELGEVARAFREGMLDIGRLINPGLEPPKMLREWELGGYSMSEINRRLLPPGLASSEVQMSDADGRVEVVYIAPESVDDATHLLGLEAARRFDTTDAVSEFFDTGAEIYGRVVRPTLAAAGLAFESPMATNDLRRAVLEVAARKTRPSV